MSNSTRIEDNKEFYPCPDECGGDISRDNNGMWNCDSCDWEPVQSICSTCNGSGYGYSSNEQRCLTCHGSGESA